MLPLAFGCIVMDRNRCFVFTGSIDLAWHNNLYRAYVHPTKVHTEFSLVLDGHQ